MSGSKDTFPPPVYLPSNGGYTSSRLASEPFHRRVFAFHRYSVEEDGRLVVRTRNAGHDSRHRPYERLSRPTTFQPNDRDISRTPQDDPPRKQVDGATMGRLFQQLVSLSADPSNFKSNAAAICAAVDLDPTTSAEIVNSFKQRFPAATSQGLSLSTTGGPTTSESSVDPEPITNPPTATKTTSTSTPFKQQRPFCSGSPGVTSWYTASSTDDITSLPPEITPEIGELYIHRNRVTDSYQVWLYGINRQWKCITGQERVDHPSVEDRVLSIRANGTPNWITTASFTTIRGRMGKARAGG